MKGLRTLSVLTALFVLVPSGDALAKRTRRGPDCTNSASSFYTSHECKVQRLRQRSFVVVALLDSGINPYHHDFRLPSNDDMIGVHPSEFIEGFPEEAPTFELALDAPDYESALAQDAGDWEAVQQDTLYTFPGTKIIGGYAVNVSANTFGGRILDEGTGAPLDPPGHGTATASIAAGFIHGASRDVETLIVAVQGIGRAPVQWATSQPWIDVVSNSWGVRANLYAPFGIHRLSKDFVEKGGSFVVGSGNGLSNTLLCDRWITPTSETTGPPWNVVVGAATASNDQPSCWHDIPPDVIAYGSFVRAAAALSLDAEREMSGTSAATPSVSGVMASLILEGRRALRDTTEGPTKGLVAQSPSSIPLPSSGPLSDGTLTQGEVEEAVLKTAKVDPFEPEDALKDAYITPNTPLYYLYAGYGLVNEETKLAALDVLFGRIPLPNRDDVDQWMETRDSAAVIWNYMP